MRRMASSCLAGFAMLALATQAFAEDMDDEEPPPLDPATLDCHAEPITGSGPGFASSREQSEGAARDNWLEKAKAVFPEADWNLALDSGIACAVQGLFSKCFAQGIPCKPKAG